MDVLQVAGGGLRLLHLALLFSLLAGFTIAAAGLLLAWLLFLKGFHMGSCRERERQFNFCQNSDASWFEKIVCT